MKAFFRLASFFLSFLSLLILFDGAKTQVSGFHREFKDQISLEMEAFTIGVFIIDVRNVISYEGEFAINQDWFANVELIMKDTGEMYNISFSETFPQPAGFKLIENYPFIFSLMVNFHDHRL